MLTNKVHQKDSQITGSLSKVVNKIAENLDAIIFLKKIIDTYELSHPEYLSVVQLIRDDHKESNLELKEYFFSRIRLFLLDESPEYKQLMSQKVFIANKDTLVIDYVMAPLMKLFEKFFSKSQYPDEFVVYFQSDTMQGLGILSISLGIKRLIVELEPFEKRSFALECEHDPENLNITLRWKK